MIVGLLSWYDENPAWLYELVQTCGQHGITHLAALDGAYAGLPGGSAQSPAAQHDALLAAARAFNVGLTLSAHRPVWQHEMAKRAALFDLGREVFTTYGITPSIHNHGDWFVVIDADEAIIKSPSSLQSELARIGSEGLFAVDIPVITPTFATKRHANPDKRFDWYRKCFRALPDLTCRGRHYTYTSESVGLLWGQPAERLLPAAELEELVMLHRHRPEDSRRVQQRTYYKERDLAGVEYDACDQCSAPAVRSFPDGTITCRKHAHLYAVQTGQRDTGRR